MCAGHLSLLNIIKQILYDRMGPDANRPLGCTHKFLEVKSMISSTAV
jgi:hypothetical protein